jgi:nicotinamidase-related amidase
VAEEDYRRLMAVNLDGVLDNCVLILTDHQPFQFAGLRSHDTQTIINNVVGLAKSAKAFDVPTLLTTVVEERGGYIIKPLGVVGTSFTWEQQLLATPHSS